MTDTDRYNFLHA